jgi:hypothetical protein
MTETDKATAYGAPWPDNSIQKRRLARPGKQREERPLCALDLFGTKADD